MNQISNEVLADLLGVLWEAGLFEELKDGTKQWLLDNGAENLLNLNAKPRLEPRLTLDEYRKHVIRMMSVPPDQKYFYDTIIDTVYFMFLVEKNPLIAQQVRGVSAISEQLQQLMKRR